MNAGLRRRHRRLWWGGAAGLAIGLWAALGARPEPAIEPALPAALLPAPAGSARP